VDIFFLPDCFRIDCIYFNDDIFCFIILLLTIGGLGVYNIDAVRRSQIEKNVRSRMLHRTKKKMRQNLIPSIVVVWSIYYYIVRPRGVRCCLQIEKIFPPRYNLLKNLTQFYKSYFIQIHRMLWIRDWYLNYLIGLSLSFGSRKYEISVSVFKNLKFYFIFKRIVYLYTKIDIQYWFRFQTGLFWFLRSQFLLYIIHIDTW